jgi:hypothetical protein
VPAGDVDLGTGSGERLGDPRQRLGAVDQDLQPAASAWRRLSGRPEVAIVRGLELPAPARAVQRPNLSDGPPQRCCRRRPPGSGR